MGKKEVLASLIKSGEGTAGVQSEAARDIDWVKVRRVQHGLSRPTEYNADSGNCEESLAEARSRRMGRLAHILGLLSGVLIGVAILRGFSEEPLLLAAALLIAVGGMLLATYASS